MIAGVVFACPVLLQAALDWWAALTGPGKPTYAVKCVDNLLIGMAMYLLPSTVWKVGCSLRDPEHEPSSELHKLKQILLGIVMAVIAVQFMAKAIELRGDLDWVHLILPLGVLVIALSMRCLGSSTSSH